MYRKNLLLPYEMRKGLSYAKVQNAMRATPVFDITNVADYFMGGTDQEYFDAAEDFPCVAPPYQTFWMEFKSPTTVNSVEKGISTRKPVWSRIGIHFIAAPMTPGLLTAITKDDETQYNLEGTKWIMSGTVYAENHPTQKKAYLGHKPGDIYRLLTYTFPVDELGRIIRGTEKKGYPVTSVDPDWAGALAYANRMSVEALMKKEDIKEFFRSLCYEVYPALLALSFLNTRGTTITENRPPYWDSKKHEAKKGRPLVTWHTLDIKPMQEVLRREGKADETGIRKALHLCRGHFRDYREGNGLFGYIKGLFWFDAHARGAKEEGIVLKDYNVKSFEET